MCNTEETEGLVREAANIVEFNIVPHAAAQILFHRSI
jgi:hypothetical protein